MPTTISYRPGDTDVDILRKILSRLEELLSLPVGAGQYFVGDFDYTILRKILQLLNDNSVVYAPADLTAAYLGDLGHDLLRKILKRTALDRIAFGAPDVPALFPIPGDSDNILLRKILTWYNVGSPAVVEQTEPYPGDTRNILLRRWLTRFVNGVPGMGVIAPTATLPDAALNVNSGDNVTFTPTYTGTAPFTYQWKKNTVAIIGATSATFTIAGAAVADDGSYTVTVTNSAGSATSNATVLTVTPPPATPTSFPNLYGWWKADSLSLADGAAVGTVGVSEWQDSSGNARHLRIADNPPHFKTNIVGTKPVVRFVEVDGVSFEDLKWVTGNFSSTSGVGTGAFTVIAVFSVTNTAAVLIGGPPGFNNRLERRRGGANTINVTLPGIFTSSVFSSGISSFACCTYRRQDGAAGDASFRENTTARGTYNATAALTLSVIGACQGIGEGMSGDLAELCIYQGHLSDADVDALYNDYLKPRWNLP